MVFPPVTVLNKTAQDVIKFLKEFQRELTANREAKVIVVGQEGVGKSTLVKSLKRTGLSLWLWNTTPPPKTDGIEISTLSLNETDCKVYDLAGDVEYLNTHALFFSHNSLHLAVFDLSKLTISKEIRSTDQFCRTELWLHTIACQDPKSYAIIVGTHADHNLLSPEVITRIRNSLYEMLLKFQPQHQKCIKLNSCDECMLCNSSKFPRDFVGNPTTANNIQSKANISDVPHILGYFEVSGITNKNVKSLKRKIESSTADIKRYTETHYVPKRWLSLRQSLVTKLSNDDNLIKQPILSLKLVREIAHELEIVRENSIVAMLRFFHCQGDFLWYEEIPDMKDFVILDPQWLSDQLRTLISHQSNVDAICNGVLHHSELSRLWCDISEENRTRLLALFRSVGLCFSISDVEDLFPCKLPVGWPDRQMWPPFPESNENQTSLLFLFSFVPPSFFPDLVVAVNEKRDSFPSNVKPLYYRFNVVYITKDQGHCNFHARYAHDPLSEPEEQCFLFHRVHIELMPYSNSLKVIIRGPNPCCQVVDIRSTIELVTSRRYPGITYKERLLCPTCEIKRMHSPSTLAYDDSHERFCPKGHNIGLVQDVLCGQRSSFSLVESGVGQATRVVGETLEDHFCPKLFAVLPINLDSLSLKDRFVYSYLRDGYAVHLLCECPEEWHFVSSPGFRVGKPNDFFKTYGGRVCKVLRVIATLGTPFKVASAVDPHLKAGVAAANAADAMSKELKVLLDSYLDKYPHLKASLGSPKDDLKDLKSSRGLQRSELARFLEVVAKGRDFGPLTCTYVDKYNEWLWLCEEHNQKYEIVERQ